MTCDDKHLSHKYKLTLSIGHIVLLSSPLSCNTLQTLIYCLHNVKSIYYNNSIVSLLPIEIIRETNLMAITCKVIPFVNICTRKLIIYNLQNNENAIQQYLNISYCTSYKNHFSLGRPSNAYFYKTKASCTHCHGNGRSPLVH